MPNDSVEPEGRTEMTRDEKRDYFRLEFVKRNEQWKSEYRILKRAFTGQLSPIEVVILPRLELNCLNFHQVKNFDEYDMVDKKDKTIVVKVHLDRQKKEILKAIEDLLNQTKRYFKTHRIDLRPLRPRFEEYEIYLKVWDLKKEGKKWKDIAGEIYPGDKDIDSAKEKVRNHYKKARKLIEERGVGI